MSDNWGPSDAEILEAHNYEYTANWEVESEDDAGEILSLMVKMRNYWRLLNHQHSMMLTMMDIMKVTIYVNHP
jgi:hypothetical protein